MSILKSVQDWLAQYPGMELVPLTDQTKETASSYAVAPVGNSATTRDVTGTRHYHNSYLFYARECALDEADRQANHDLIESLTDWIEAQSDSGNLPFLPGKYAAESVEASNGMLMEVGKDGLGIYQIQIQMTLYKRSDT